jgi:hypothetical protein
VATTTSGDSQEEHGEHAAESKSRAQKWSDADKRLFQITFLGGLAANLGLVVVLGLAVLSARGVGWYFGHVTRKATLAANVVYPLSLVYGLAMIVLFRWQRRHRLSRHVNVIFSILLYLPAELLLLGLLGYAAGIK